MIAVDILLNRHKRRYWITSRPFTDPSVFKSLNKFAEEYNPNPPEEDNVASRDTSLKAIMEAILDAAALVPPDANTLSEDASIQAFITACREGDGSMPPKRCRRR
ncbi:hypothetical protein EON65_01645 [archaeon]|nr:MAG: hypothetical protein EON65_01645 [archaeon]